MAAGDVDPLVARFVWGETSYRTGLSAMIAWNTAVVIYAACPFVRNVLLKGIFKK